MTRHCTPYCVESKQLALHFTLPESTFVVYNRLAQFKTF